MRNFLIVISFIFSIHMVKGQISYEDLIKPRINCSSLKINHDEKSKYIVLEQDTLYTNYKNLSNLNNLYPLFSDKKMMYKYKKQVFKHSKETSKVVYYLKQWSVDIVIFIDKKIPKEVQNDFVQFLSQIKGVNNLNISFSSKLKDANYYIKVSSVDINGYEPSFDFDSEEERLNSVFTGGTYNIITDKNKKFYGAILSVYLENNLNSYRLLKQLKQLFYSSLGQFYLSSSSTYKESSLLSISYNNSSELNKNDLDLLKIHYAIIYEQKISSTTFNKLLKFLNSKQ